MLGTHEKPRPVGSVRGFLCRGLEAYRPVTDVSSAGRSSVADAMAASPTRTRTGSSSTADIFHICARERARPPRLEAEVMPIPPDPFGPHMVDDPGRGRMRKS
jgi:hypothetical protein